MHRPLRLTTALLAALVALAALAAPSYAGHRTIEDARGDLVKVHEGEVHTQPAPDVALGDLVRTTVRHTTRRVVVDLAFADLRPVGKRLQVWVDMREPIGRFTLLGIRATPQHRDGVATLMRARGGDIACPALRHRIDYDSDTVHASLPRRCLGSPRALRFRALSEQSRANLGVAWIDNALTTRHVWSRRWTSPVVAGP